MSAVKKAASKKKMPVPDTRSAPRQGGSAPPRILMAAIEEFGRHGFEGASIAEIAKRAGVVKPLVHYHFKTKDQLWYAAVRQAMSQLQTDMARLPFEVRGIDPVEAFKLAVRKYSYFCAHNPWVARMILSEAVRETPRALWVQKEYQEPAYQMFEGLQQMVALSGRFRTISPSHLLPMINGAINAFAADRGVLRKRYGLDNSDPKTVERHAEIVVDTLLNGLLLPPRGA